MMDRLVVLGSKGGPAIRTGGPSPTSMLIELQGRPIVIDCGLGVTRGLVDAGIALRDLEMILITHLHSDHVLELGPLLHTAWTAGLSSVVRVYGPPGTGHVWSRFLQSMEFDIEIRIADEGRPDLRSLVTVEEFGEGEVVGSEELRVVALRNDHPPVIESFALRLEGGGKAIVLSGDTAPFPPLVDFAQHADILVHEAMLPQGIDRLVARTGNGTRLKEHLLASHSFAADAGRIASEAGVGMLVLNHLIPADDPDISQEDWFAAVRETWDGELVVASDGTVVPFDRQDISSTGRKA